MPVSEARLTVTGLLAVLLPPGVSTPPVLSGLVSTVAVLVPMPPAGALVKRTGNVMVARPPASSWPSAQLILLPATLQLPPPTGSVRAKLTPPVNAAPAGRVSVRSVCSELPGPLLSTVTVQVKGSLIATLAALAALATRRSIRCRMVVLSLTLLFAALPSGSLALTNAWLKNTSPAGAGRSSASKRRNTVLLWPAARSPRARPVLALPGGTSQVKAARATPAGDSLPAPVHSAGALQTLPPAALVSQMKRTRLPAGGVIVSVMVTPVP